MAACHCFLAYPANLGPISVSELVRKLLIPRKWRHFLRTEKQILINDHHLPLNFLVEVGNKIGIYLNHVRSDQQTYPANGKSPKIVYEDSDILVIDKPTRQKTYPNLDEKDTALGDCTTYLGHSPFIVHRFDMLTDGLLLVIKNPAIVPVLNRQLTNKTLHRECLAWVSKSNQSGQSGAISLSIRHGPDGQRKRMVRLDGQRAITRYEVVKECENKELAKLTLETRCTHQIKVYLAALGTSIIGDPLYNPNYQNGEKLQLTAYRLIFMGPFKFESKTAKLIEK